jgi:hypothetical protein
MKFSLLILASIVVLLIGCASTDPYKEVNFIVYNDCGGQISYSLYVYGTNTDTTFATAFFDDYIYRKTFLIQKEKNMYDLIYWSTSGRYLELFRIGFDKEIAEVCPLIGFPDE